MLLLFLSATALHAQVPQLINYQGRVAAGGVNFDGSGRFKFALVNASGTTSHWSNDGTSAAGSEPAAAVTLTVSNSLYSVLLGDATLPNMAAIPAGVLNNSDVFVRVWFNDGTNGSEQLAPDQGLATPARVNARGVQGGNLPAATDCWKQLTSGSPPSGRADHTAVWTGSEMIVWGGWDGGELNDGGRYRPDSNTWTRMSKSGAPQARFSHTAVWTGSELIVWGGAFHTESDEVDPLNTGGRYDPAADRWTTVNPAGGPSARYYHTAVWTGSEMIVWGGSLTGGAEIHPLNTGGRYDPAGNSWTAVSATGAPSARLWHTAVWTGSEMIVWGGTSDVADLNDGGRYDPVGNRWTAVSPTVAPSARSYHKAVWTGSEMIVWSGFGGGVVNDGGRYDPAANSWTAVSTTGAPTGRYYHTAVWTGSEMIVWGGNNNDGPQNTGGRYNPEANSWTVVTTIGRPSTGYFGHTAVWTGSEMIVWGGYEAGVFSDSGRYNPAGNRWMAVSTGAPDAPDARGGHTAVWTGSEMIVWGGEGDDSGYLMDGGRFTPAGSGWVPVSTTGAPSARYGHTAVWTGSEMIVWGGYNGGDGTFTLNDGGRYLPAINSWTPLSTAGAPGGRAEHTAVWTGSEMIVWGGSSDDALNDGGRYDPAGNRWTAVSPTGAPAARCSHTAVWTGSEMIVWGGTPDFSGGLNTGGRYHPAGDSWIAVNTVGAPAARRSHTAVWTGSEMIVWGGGVFPNAFDGGGRYHPEENRWTPVATMGAPDARFDHTAVWTGSEMIVWGGTPDFVNGLNTGGRYRPAGNSWTAMTTTGAPAARRDHTAVWTGSEMIVWGGWNGSGNLNDTFSYTPDCRVFDFTSVVRSGANLILTFPTLTGRTYTLWRSDTLAASTWINTGLPSIAGTGTTLTFTVPVPAAARRFFRVHADQ